MSARRLPIEILLQIFYYLDVPDIIRTRMASRYLSKVSRFRDVWAYAYHNAKFICPPGPFPSQTASDLESTLVSSFRIDRNFRGGAAARKIGEVQYTGTTLCVSLVFARFLLITLREEVRCYDVNTNGNTGYSVIYRPTGGVLVLCQCDSAFDTYGRSYACMVLKEEVQEGSQIQASIYLLNVKNRSELSLDLLHQFQHSTIDICSVDLGPRVVLVHSIVGPFEEDCIVALDVHSHVHLLFPPLKDMWGIDKTDMLDDNMSTLSTSTHILLTRLCHVSDNEFNTIFAAFALPLPSMYYAGSTTLSCSHRGAVPDTEIDNLKLLSDSIICTLTQDVLVVAQGEFIVDSDLEPDVWSGLLRLGRSSHDEVGTIACQHFSEISPLPGYVLDRPSFHGIGRTYIECVAPDHHGIRPSASASIMVSEYDRMRTDKVGGMYMCATRGYLSFRYSLIPQVYMRVVDDAYGGRICLKHSDSGNSIVEILDFDV